MSRLAIAAQGAIQVLRDADTILVALTQQQALPGIGGGLGVPVPEVPGHPSLGLLTDAGSGGLGQGFGPGAAPGEAQEHDAHQADEPQ